MTENNHKIKENKFALFSSKFRKFISIYSSKTIYSNAIIAISFLFLGVFGTLTFQSIKHHYEVSIIKKHLGNFYHDFDNDYVGLTDDNQDIQREINQIQKITNQALLQHRQFFDQNNLRQNFTAIESKNNNSSNVKLHEDDKFLYYELVFNGFSKDEITAEIKDNILTFQAIKKSGEANISDNNSKKNQEVVQQNTASFSYSFLLSNFNDSVAADITKLDDKVIVKIAKKLTHKAL